MTTEATRRPADSPSVRDALSPEGHGGLPAGIEPGAAGPSAEDDAPRHGAEALVPRRCVRRRALLWVRPQALGSAPPQPHTTPALLRVGHSEERSDRRGRIVPNEPRADRRDTGGARSEDLRDARGVHAAEGDDG